MSLIAPLRAAADDAEKAARMALEQLPEEWRVSMGFDAALHALDTWQYVGAVASGMRQEMRDVAARRKGFDTWAKHDLDIAFSRLRCLAVLFDQLAVAITDIQVAEHAEISELRAEAIRSLNSRPSTFNCAGGANA